MTRDEALEAFAALTGDERAALRTHARHMRAHPLAPEFEQDVCPEPGCVEHRDRAALLHRLRSAVSGPRMLAAALGVSEYEARKILLDGPAYGRETVRVRAMLDGGGE